MKLCLSVYYCIILVIMLPTRLAMLFRIASGNIASLWYLKRISVCRVYKLSLGNINPVCNVPQINTRTVLRACACARACVCMFDHLQHRRTQFVTKHNIIAVRSTELFNVVCICAVEAVLTFWNPNSVKITICSKCLSKTTTATANRNTISWIYLRP